MTRILSAIHNLFTHGSTLSRQELLEAKVRERNWFERTKKCINGILEKHGVPEVRCRLVSLKSVHGGPFLDLILTGRFPKDKVDAYSSALKEIKKATGMKLGKTVAEEFHEETNSFELDNEDSSYFSWNRIVSCSVLS